MASEFSKQYEGLLQPTSDPSGFSEAACAATRSNAEQEQSLQGGCVQFGPFMLDLENRELSRAGLKTKVQNKVYEALVVLLERPGEIVTREELCKRLWPEDSQVNYEANVNTTVNKLRQLLGDSPAVPQFVETIPRRGYSFIAKVEKVGTAGPQENLRGDIVDTGAVLQASPDFPSELRPRNSILARVASFANAIPARWLVASVFGLLLAGFLLGMVIVLFGHSARPKPSSGIPLLAELKVASVRAAP